MDSTRRAALGLGLLALALAAPAFAQTSVVREFTYAAGRFALTTHDGLTRIRVAGGLPELHAGRPDLPTVGERVEIPAGFRVSRIEVTALETALLAGNARPSPAMEARQGDLSDAPTAPDPAYYGRAGFQPELPAALGIQGFDRGRNIAYVLVSPVRWDAASGRLERVTRLAVRLILEPSDAAPVPRERVVPEWERRGAGRPASPDEPLARAGLAMAPRKAQPFRATQLPSLLGSPVAYLIITSDAMAASFQPLADWKTQSGLPAAVRTLGLIRQQYPGGVDDGERIRDFIRDAYTRWGTRWVLLGGDTDVLPVRKAHVNTPEVEDIPTDAYYSCLDGNWNADGDSTWGEGFSNASNPGDAVDLMPEVWVGRAPVDTPADADLFVSKTMTYELTPVGDYMKNILFFAEVLFPQYWSPGQATTMDGAELVEYDVYPYLNEAPWLHIARLYENYTDARWRPGALQETRRSVLDSLARGYNIAVHIGHGYRTVMSCGDNNISNNDAYTLANGNRLINLYAIDCTSNAIDFTSLGEAFLRAPNGGAVTNIGSTRLDYPTVGRYFQEEYFRLMIEDSVTAVGEAQAMQKVPFLGTAYYDGLTRWTEFTLLLLGDPELRIYTNTPRHLVVAVAGTMALDDSTFAANVTVGGVPLEGAKVTAYMPGRDYSVGTTDGAGNVVLPFRPDTLGKFTLTVTAFNAQPYQKNVTVVAGSGASFAAQPPVVVDDNLDGRQGNGNGLPDAGEVVDVRVALRNTGGAKAPGVTGTLSTTDGLISVTVPGVGYGDVNAGALSAPAAGYRIVIPSDCPDQREVPFRLDVVSADGKHWQRTFQLTVHAPELIHLSHVESEPVGNGNGSPEPGETVSYALRLRNAGTGTAAGLHGRLRDYDGLATVLDSAFTVPDLAPGAEGVATPVRFVPTSVAAKLALLVYDAYGLRLTQTLDLGYPAAPIALKATGATSAIQLRWTHNADADIAGYNVYRADASGGPYTRITAVPAPRMSNYIDQGLPGLTRHYYEVSVLDSSANESAPSAFASATTNPPFHAGFPIILNYSTSSPIAVDHVYPGYPQEILVGADVLHLFHADGTAPVDADASAATPGDFTTEGSFYAGGGSISDLDGDGQKEIIGAAWNSQELSVLDRFGTMRPGFPAHIQDQMWSSVAVGDLDGDGTKEMVFAGRSDQNLLGKDLFVFRANGAEWMDGDSNPTTLGVFKVMGYNFNHGTPALADLLGNGQKDIVFGGFDGFLYAWKPDGSNVPGFPLNLHAPITSSAAIGKLDGPGGAFWIVIAAANDSLYVIGADGGRRAGFPRRVASTGTNRSPSPALADLNGDGYPDVVAASTGGVLAVYDRNGATLAPLHNVRFSTMVESATECSPVVADINGDGFPDVVVGDENGYLNGLSGADGSVLPGFPIEVGAEATGTPALCDCDGDGKTEIVTMDYGRTLFMWDYDYPFSPGGPPAWPQFHHDAERTGNLSTPILLDAGEVAAAAPRTVELAAPWPNPARVSLRLSYGVPATQDRQPYEVAVYDLAGRRVRLVERGTARAGRHSLDWDLRDEAGGPARAGVYFARVVVGPQAAVRKLIVVR